MPGLDGRKMSKSYDNTISLRDSPADIEQKLKTMPTDPARVRRTDPGDPAKCPVWDFHLVYSDEKTQQWVQEGCRSAGIGCLECKKPVIDAVLAELRPIQERAAEFSRDPILVKNIIAEGCKRARDVAEQTLSDVRAAMGLRYT
jgi:tryptophanyl-tRNA synthetase